ncbi:MAG: hypothetical protein COX81_00890 [Candidatus Magasanikbacteria bacterium CG_4_10_14_0_2_um_filter_37_12]|uniref:Uncharacterized protein n=1 Tax=Candidatus Magasanikbacteria bacterium CG_4_10_14_0_2_um_filter_37_12 TaxID=1974637 RepID=A0A2M7V996_9BACT|nr:MAG: hypothetical protein COX81_00890 [Candidatus Magasanikbacteria bacterium CG_4_10_14_0_2_um_filter_37_12]
MSAKLERLIRLAKKTGDTLIIHDKDNTRDMVLMDVDQYEMMVDNDTIFGHGEDCGRQNLYEMSEGEMLDKINRDISIWRSQKDLDDEWSRNEHLDKYMAEHPLPDPFEEDFVHHTDWHDAGSILGDRYKGLSDFEVEDEDDDELEDGIHFDTPNDEFQVEDVSVFDNDVDFGEMNLESNNELQSIPFSLPDSETDDWEEEHLPGEEPIFFEEPIR